MYGTEFARIPHGKKYSNITWSTEQVLNMTSLRTYAQDLIYKQIVQKTAYNRKLYFHIEAIWCKVSRKRTEGNSEPRLG